MSWLLTGAAAALYWVMSLTEGHGILRSLIKGLSVAPLAVFAYVQGAAAVAAALGLCALGDVVLSRPGERAFLGGLIAFALGHLAWIAVFAFYLGIDPARLWTPLMMLLIAGLVVLAVAMACLMLPKAAALKVPVGVYICIIIAMGLTAFATASGFVIAGAVLFACSDALLGLQTFVLTRGERPERLANALIWPLYWGAIVLLTLGAFSA